MAKPNIINAEKNILEQLAYYKWGSTFCCVRCGNDSYWKGKKEFSRRCRNCKREESLTKYTALEGIRFPVAKAYRIIEELLGKVLLAAHGKPIIPTEDGKLITGPEYVQRSYKLGMSADRVSENLEKFIAGSRPSVRSLANKYKIEANSLTKLLDKINNRMSLAEAYEEDNSYKRIIRLMDERHRHPLSYFISMLMIPLVGEWEYGETNIGPNRYAIEYDRLSERWHIIQIVLSEIEDYAYYIEEPEYKRTRVNDTKIEYGSNMWKDLFVVSKNTHV